MTMLQRLIPRQIWTDSKLWQGYIMACKVRDQYSLQSPSRSTLNAALLLDGDAALDPGHSLVAVASDERCDEERALT